jgi:3-oxoacyl-[acyl-carrier protein] reductase
MKNIIVTGGSCGIGAKIVERFAQEGNRVILNYNKSEAEAEKIKQKFPDNIILYKADVGVFNNVKSMCDFCIENYGCVDILVNNAGIAQIKPFADITEEDWDTMLDTNLKSAFLCSQAVLPKMISNKSGKIVNISSMWGVSGASCEVHYSAAKAGVIGLTKALAKEVGLSGVRVNAIAPGVISTDMLASFTEEDMAVLKEETPLNRIGNVEDIAKSVCFLASEDSSFITGQVISVNGGFVI